MIMNGFDMTDDFKQLKIYIESTIVDERNHIFKYTSPLSHPQSSQAKAVFLEYDRATSNDRYHNYNVGLLAYGDHEVKEKDIPSFYEFLAKKLRYYSNQDRESYARSRILAPFNVYDEDGAIEDTKIQYYDFSGETDHEIFSMWLLFRHLFEIEEQIAKQVVKKDFIGIPLCQDCCHPLKSSNN